MNHKESPRTPEGRHSHTLSTSTPAAKQTEHKVESEERQTASSTTETKPNDQKRISSGRQTARRAREGGLVPTAGYPDVFYNPNQSFCDVYIEDITKKTGIRCGDEEDQAPNLNIGESDPLISPCARLRRAKETSRR